MIQSMERRLTKAKEAPSPQEVRLAPMDTNPVSQCLWGKANTNCHTSTLKLDLSKHSDSEEIYKKNI